MAKVRQWVTWSGIFILVSIAILAFTAICAYSSSETVVNKVGVVGSVASILGIIFTVGQVIDAKRLVIQARDASIAAEEASRATSRELRNSYYRYSLHTARRLLSEIKSFVVSSNWPFAAVRPDDLGDCVSQLIYVRAQPDEEWIVVRRSLHAWAIHFRTGRAKRSLEYSEPDWADLCIFIGDKINRECDPLE